MYYRFTKKAEGRRLGYVALAVPRHDVRYYLNYINVADYDDGRHAVATDGHRLHVAWNAVGIEPGFYTVLRNNRSEIWLAAEDPEAAGTYPDWRSVMKTSWPDYDDDASAWIRAASDAPTVYYHVVSMFDVCLAYEYVRDAVSMNSPVVIGSDRRSSEINAVIFKYEELDACAMVLPRLVDQPKFV